jgi:hypothetical protein
LFCFPFHSLVIIFPINCVFVFHLIHFHSFIHSFIHSLIFSFASVPSSMDSNSSFYGFFLLFMCLILCFFFLRPLCKSCSLIGLLFPLCWQWHPSINFYCLSFVSSFILFFLLSSHLLSWI